MRGTDDLRHQLRHGSSRLCPALARRRACLGLPLMPRAALSGPLDLTLASRPARKPALASSALLLSDLIAEAPPCASRSAARAPAVAVGAALSPPAALRPWRLLKCSGERPAPVNLWARGELLWGLLRSGLCGPATESLSLAEQRFPVPPLRSPPAAPASGAGRSAWTTTGRSAAQRHLRQPVAPSSPWSVRSFYHVLSTDPSRRRSR
jgi:hypothetical protein